MAVATPPACPRLAAALALCITDEGLVEDVLEACRRACLGADEIGSWNCEETAARLYLTRDEAAALLRACNEPEETVPAEAAPTQCTTPRLPSTPAVTPVLMEPEFSDFTLPESAKIPSYLRPTANHTVRSSKQVIPEITNKPMGRTNMMSRLLAPTAAFLARITLTKKESKAAREAAKVAEDVRKSQTLTAVLSSPRGQRVTRPHAFHFGGGGADARRTALKSSEEAQLEEAQRHAYKPHVVPKGLRETRPLEGFARTHSVAKDPAAEQQPFHLASLEKHAKYQALRSARLEKELLVVEEHRRFKAQALDKSMLEALPEGFSKSPSPKQALTVSVAPVFASAARAAHYDGVLSPARLARMSVADREAMAMRELRVAEAAMHLCTEAADQAASKAREAALATMEVSELRKSLVFTARGMPDFSSPFKTDAAKAQPVTRPVAFELTSSRISSPRAAYERNPLTQSACFDQQGYSSAFSASLRTSYGVGANPLRMSINSRAALGTTIRPASAAITPRATPRTRPATAFGASSTAPSPRLPAPKDAKSFFSPRPQAPTAFGTETAVVTSPQPQFPTVFDMGPVSAAHSPRATPSGSVAAAEFLKATLAQACELAASPRALSRRATAEVGAAEGRRLDSPRLMFAA
eukprot:CAMPEP_0119103568 /NCGR_PEP_ID=MMETSP1180-20130426/1984_1 /TAXON_ID=3052 ORGANISM="Chlamydomonas cf sp, Strain CCMP681" /NCGR_SAMPLE_ID=MMETSP1180 /ASSEMBLY_ACC=CAM_ASM_000741 /LENGTH=641 /DNA_ID=CAMNT_0007088117 /DNA_START=72 /DNA_END=1997 /DNA_ORIENTATION=-